MPFTTGMTGTTEVPVEVLVALRGSFQISLAVNDLISQLAITQLSADTGNGRLFNFGSIAPIPTTTTTLLDEYEDPNSTPLSGSTSDYTAQEHGLVVTRTSLADTISGGALSRVAAARVGEHAAATLNKLGAAVLAAGTNALFAGAGTSAGLVAGDVMTPALFNRAYNALSKAGARKDAAGFYRVVLHADQIYDLKQQVGAGSWNDVNKYSDPATVLKGEVATFGGFRVIESNLITPANQSGGAVDVYKAVFFGLDALGQGIAVGPDLRLTFTDKLNRFANYGWYACIVFGIISQENVFVVNTSSSLGVNA